MKKYCELLKQDSENSKYYDDPKEHLKNRHADLKDESWLKPHLEGLYTLNINDIMIHSVNSIKYLKNNLDQANNKISNLETEIFLIKKIIFNSNLLQL